MTKTNNRNRPHWHLWADSAQHGETWEISPALIRQIECFVGLDTTSVGATVVQERRHSVCPALPVPQVHSTEFFPLRLPDNQRRTTLSILSSLREDLPMKSWTLWLRPCVRLTVHRTLSQAQQAIRDALSELLNQFPEADLLDLSEDQSIFAIENFIALDVFNRFNLDLGKTLQDKAPTASAALSRLKDVKDYIKQTVSAQFRALHTAEEQLNAHRISDLAQQALQNTFEVFEEYVQ